MSTALASSKVVVRSAAYNLLGFVASAAYLLALIPLVVGFIGIEQFGLWSLIVALTGYFGLLDMGLGMSFTKFIAEHAARNEHNLMSAVVQHGLLFYSALSIGVLLVGYVLSPVVLALLNMPDAHLDLARIAFLIALLSFGVNSMAHVFGSVLSGIQRMDVYNKLLIVMLAAKFAAIFILLVSGYGLLGMMVADLVVTCVSMVPLIMLTRKHVPQMSLRMRRFDRRVMKRLLVFGSQLQIGRFAEMVQLQFDKILLGRYIGLAAVSLYDFGSRPLVRLRALPLTVIQSLVPAISALDAEDNPTRIHAAHIRATRYMVIVALPMFVFLALFADEVIRLWLGERHYWAAVTMQIFAFAYFVNVVGSVLGFVSQGKGEPKYQMQAMLIQAVINIVLSIALFMMFGYFGAVAGTAVSMVFGSTIFLHQYGKRVMARPIRTILRIASKPVWSVVPAVGVGLMLDKFLTDAGFDTTRLDMGFLLCVCGTGFLLAYGVMLKRTSTFTDDDKGFIRGVVPQRLKYLLRWL